MSLEFPYRREPSSQEEFVYRPVAKVTLKGNSGREVVDYFYIDSGADHTLIPYKLGCFLGLNTKRGEVCEVQGINGVVGVIFTKVSMKIGDEYFESKVGWAQVEHVPLLLGRCDVFDRFKITFHQSEKKVIFEAL